MVIHFSQLHNLLPVASYSSWTGVPGATSTILFDTPTGTSGGDITVAEALVNAYKNATGNKVYYYANGDTFFAAAQLSSTEYWCVDANGYGGIIPTAPALGATACK